MDFYHMTPLRGSPSPTRFSYTETPIREAPLEICKAVTEVFRTIALEEGDIERLRQVFAHMPEFASNQRALFDLFDTSKDGQCSAEEMANFLGQNLVKGQTAASCSAIIAEFDSSQDGRLNFDEFLNVFLPAADYNVRGLGFIGEPRGLRTVDGSLPSSVPSMAARILEREALFHGRRAEARRALAGESEEALTEVFAQISRGRPEITMTDVIWFCERYGFQPSTEDLEAILRRCDHDADRALSFEEFAELLGQDYTKLMEARRVREDRIRAEREAELEKLRLEREAAALEWEKKVELERLEREKRFEEVRLEAEAREAARQKEIEAWRAERELEIQKARQAEEARRKEIEIQMELERAERDKRIAEAQKDAELRRADREKELAALQAEREVHIEKQRQHAEARRAEHQKEVELAQLEREKRIEEARAEQERRYQDYVAEQKRLRAEVEARAAAERADREARELAWREEQEKLRAEAERRLEEQRLEREARVAAWHKDQERLRLEAEKRVEEERLERERRIKLWEAEQEQIRAERQKAAELARMEAEKREEEIRLRVELERKERDAQLEKWRAEREAELERRRLEAEQYRAEAIKRAEEERAARDKRANELRAEAEARRAEEERRIELARLEHEKRLEEARAAAELREKELRDERERRLAEWQVEQERVRAEREREYELARLEHEKRVAEATVAAEAERKRREEEAERHRIEIQAELDRREAERELWRKESSQIAQQIITCVRDRSEQLMKLENKQRLLSFNSAFDARELFREIDADKSGWLSAHELATWAARVAGSKSGRLAGVNWGEVVRFWSRRPDSDEEPKLFFEEFAAGITGGFYTHGYSHTVVEYDVFGGYPRTLGPRPLAELDATTQANIRTAVDDVILEAAGCAALTAKPLSRDQAERLWDNLDVYGHGGVGPHAVGEWLLAAAGHSAPTDHIEGLLGLPYGAGMVSRAQFVESLSHADADDDKRRRSQPKRERSEDRNATATRKATESLKKTADTRASTGNQQRNGK